MTRTRLSVNINKIALLRNARGGNLPDLFKAARDIENYGGEGITVHPRPDERHARYSDLQPLKDLVTTEFNIEGYPSEKFLDQVLRVKPHQCTLVPDPPGVLTSDTGWNTIEQQAFLKEVVGKLKKEGIRVSLFLDPDPAFINGARDTGADRIELYTGDYAAEYDSGKERAISRFVKTAEAANQAGLGINAGHDLNLDNLQYFAQNIPGLLEVSIGHALVCDSLYFGLQNVIQMYLLRLSNSCFSA